MLLPSLTLDKKDYYMKIKTLLKHLSTELLIRINLTHLVEYLALSSKEIYCIGKETLLLFRFINTTISSMTRIKDQTKESHPTLQIYLKRVRAIISQNIIKMIVNELAQLPLLLEEISKFFITSSLLIVFQLPRDSSLKTKVNLIKDRHIYPSIRGVTN